MMAWNCIFIQETGIVRLSLRRYAGDKPCSVSGTGYHNAQIPIEETEQVGEGGVIGDFNFEKPLMEKYIEQFDQMKCTCGYQFANEDNRQIFRDREYTDDQGNKFTQRDAPIGSMWYSEWHERFSFPSPDGKALVVKLPANNEWCVDGQASNCQAPCKNCAQPFEAHAKGQTECKDFQHSDPNHRCWQRSGTPPMITASPSIQVPGYHGFLQNGQLTDPC